MPKKQSKSTRTTLYRVRGISDLTETVRPKYLSHGGFNTEATVVEGREALLVLGTMRRDQATWAPRLADITALNVDVGNMTAAAILLIRIDEASAWALSYGMGFQLIDPAALDAGFGMRVAIRTASPEAIQSLTRTELDHRSRTDRSSIPAGEALRGFGIGDFGEVITRISGSATLGGLTAGSGSIRVRAADALSLPLGKTASALISDLDAITAALSLDPQPELQALEQFVRVKDPRMIESLEGNLRSNLVGGSTGRLALGWPHERIDDNGTPSSFALTGTGNKERGVSDDLPSLEEIVTALRVKDASDPLAAAKTIKVQLYRDADGDEAISGAIPAIHWLFYEVHWDGVRYCLFDSRWYAMDTDYASRLQRHVDEIFSRQTPLQLPNWDTDHTVDEASYNVAAAAAVGGVVLDRRLLRTTEHPRGFESCDIITPAGDLVHVKHTPKSSAASHLIAQAVVSTEALRHDDEARQALRAVIDTAGGNQDWLPDRLTSVVLGMARKRLISASDLFSFTQVTLARLDSSLADGGVVLGVVPILRGPGV